MFLMYIIGYFDNNYSLNIHIIIITSSVIIIIMVTFKALIDLFV